MDKDFKLSKGKLSKKQQISCIVVVFIFTIAVILIFSPKSQSPATQPANQTEQPTITQPTNQELLELLSFRCYSEYGYFHITGEVKNISNESLKSVVAVGTAYTEGGEFVKSDEALIDYNPILSGQISPFEVLFTGNPAIKKCKVGFKKFWGGSIPTKIK